MKQALNLVWCAVNDTRGKAPLHNWELLAGEQYRFIKAFLKPTNTQVCSLPCPGICDNCVREVRPCKEDHSKVILKCGCTVEPNRCKTVAVPKKEVISYEVHWRKLAEEIADLFCLHAEYCRMGNDFKHVHKIGYYIPLAWERHTVYFAIPCPNQSLYEIASDLKDMHGDTHFAIFLPTFDDINQKMILKAKRLGCDLFSLEDITHARINGDIHLDCDVDMLFTNLRNNILNKYKSDREKQGLKFFPTPPQATWKDVIIKFKDGHMVYVYCKGIVRKVKYDNFGMGIEDDAKPTVIWEFMRQLSENRSRRFRTSGDDKVRQYKRRLTKHLKDFFGIPDDPMPADNKGYAELQFKLIGESEKIPDEIKNATQDDLEISSMFDEFANYEKVG